MGVSRKLQGEIDRVLTKVHEGVEVIDSIWDKVYNTDNANHKEKLEGDLNKEIKKLQRYRERIKSWIQSNEIKDRKVSVSYEKTLVDARKLIEQEMKRFKSCEKQTKTKAFFKDGLGQQPKTDPNVKAKSETRDWLNDVVGELESQIDNFEAELEGLSLKKGKSKPPRLTHLETSITRHKAHIKKCELLLRLVDNDKLSPREVNDVKDFLEDYIERNQEDFGEFDDVDELYSLLPLDKLETLEDLVTVPANLSLKNPLTTSASQSTLSQTSEQGDDTTSEDDELSPGQLLQSNQQHFGKFGVIGRKNSGVRDHIYELQMLDAALSKLPLPEDSERFPQPEDSERSRVSYTPRHPTITPPSYPQVPAPLVNNPAFWERVGLDPFSNDILYFAFYYQQNTYQQYLAAKELKKQAWRYHQRYNTWFRRYEMPRVATDEYEQGTFVYFDSHVPNDGQQQGWCYRIKPDFTFEYNHLEDELV